MKLTKKDLTQITGGLTSMVAGARCLPNSKAEGNDLDVDDNNVEVIVFPNIYGF